jgi:hypothetical protein
MYSLSCLFFLYTTISTYYIKSNVIYTNSKTLKFRRYVCNSWEAGRGGPGRGRVGLRAYRRPRSHAWCSCRVRARLLGNRTRGSKRNRAGLPIPSLAELSRWGLAPALTLEAFRQRPPEFRTWGVTELGFSPSMGCGEEESLKQGRLTDASGTVHNV